VRGHQFTYYDYPVNPLTIWASTTGLSISWSTTSHRRQQDAQDYIARLSRSTLVEQLLEGLRLREQAASFRPVHLEESITRSRDIFTCRALIHFRWKR